MIYLFHGSDTKKVRTKAFEWVAKARAKEPNLAYRRLAREEVTETEIEDVAHSGGLFVSRLLVLLDEPFAPARAKSAEEEEVLGAGIVEEYVDTLAESDNAIVIIASGLSASKAKKLTAKAKVEYRFDKSERSEVSRGFNSALVNALGAGNGAALWLEIHRALIAGDEPEMIHGLLHWKARDLMAKKRTDESRRLSIELLRVLQDSRRGGLELPLALERFSLVMK